MKFYFHSASKCVILLYKFDFWRLLYGFIGPEIELF